MTAGTTAAMTTEKTSRVTQRFFKARIASPRISRRIRQSWRAGLQTAIAAGIGLALASGRVCGADTAHLPVQDAPVASRDPNAVFLRARAAYDAGDLPAAREAYRALLAAGYDVPEVRFNLGNTLVRAGEWAEAIAQYRIAQYARPRDPDIAANLRFSLERAGAAAPALPLLRMWARRLSRSEWLAVLATAWGVMGAALAGALLWPRGRRALLRTAAGAAAVALAAAGGWLEWRFLDLHPEAVVRVPDTPARFAPIADATVHFTLPSGSIVRVMGREGGWYSIRLDGRTGWISTEAALLLSSPPTKSVP